MLDYKGHQSWHGLKFERIKLLAPKVGVLVVLAWFIFWFACLAPSDLTLPELLIYPIVHIDNYVKIRPGADDISVCNRIRGPLDEMDPVPCCHVKRIAPWSQSPNAPDLFLCADRWVDSDNCFVLSFGVNYEWHFEDAMLAQGCTVWSFDPSMSPGHYSRGPKHTFFNKGLAVDDGKFLGTSLYRGKDDLHEYISLGSIMESAPFDHITLLRMDIEGAEWPIFDSLAQNDAFVKYNVQQFSGELHFPEGSDPKEKARSITQLGKSVGMKHISSGANYWCPRHTTNPGLTACYEFSMAVPT